MAVQTQLPEAVAADTTNASKASPSKPNAKPQPLTPEQMAIVKSTAPILKEQGVAITTVFYRQMLEAHPELHNIFNRANQATGEQPRALASLVFAFAQHVDNLQVLGSAVRHVAHKHVSLNVQPEHYAVVGKYLIGAVAQVLGPEVVTPAVAEAWIAAYAVLADLFISLEDNMYQSHDEEWQKLHHQSQQAAKEDNEEKSNGTTTTTTTSRYLGAWRKFRIQKRANESADGNIVSFYLVPEDGKAIPRFSPGQFVSLRIPIPELGCLQPRQYSLSDVPGGNYYRISVKREPWHSEDAPGLVSNMLHDKYREGDSVELTHPMGDFSADVDAAAAAESTAADDANNSNITKSNGPLVLLSAGVGVTPMISILNTALASAKNDNNSTKKQRPISWIHGAHSPSSRAFSQHIRDVVASNDNVSAHLFLSSVTDNGNGDDDDDKQKEEETTSGGAILEKGVDYHHEGRVDLDKIAPGEGGLFLGDASAEYYVCGPVDFMAAVRENLVTKKGVDESRVHLEVFGVAK